MKKYLCLGAVLYILCLFGMTAAADTLTLPETLERIEEQAFYGDTSLDEVVLPEGLAEIGSQAFANSSVSEVNLPDSLNLIAEDAFDGTNVVKTKVTVGTYAYRWALLHGLLDAETVASGECGEQVTWSLDANGLLRISGIGAMTDYHSSGDIPWDCKTVRTVIIKEGVTHIGEMAFCLNSIVTDVFIPNSVISIGNSAFASPGLTSISIPASVTEIGIDVFAGCSTLTEIVVAAENSAYKSENGVLFSKNGSVLHCYPSSKAGTTYQIPASVTTIDVDAFFECVDLEVMMIPNTVTGIAQDAFANCTGLQQITLSESMTEISYYTFRNCTGLTSVTIPSGINFIGNGAFQNCVSLSEIYYSGNEADWRSIYISDNNDVLESAVFHYPLIPTNQVSGVCGDQLTWEISANGVLTISGIGPMENYTYDSGKPWDEYQESFDMLVVGSGVTSIGTFAFSNTRIASVTLPDSLTTIGGNAFSYCKALTVIDLPDSVTYIGDGAFSDSSISTLVLPSQLTKIPGFMCRSCRRLTNIVIPEQVTFIGEEAFADTGLRFVFIPSGVEYLFHTCYNCDSLESIDISENNEFYSSLDGVQYSKDMRVLQFCPRMKMSVTIPPTVESISLDAFDGCTRLTSIEIPDSVTRISTFAFHGCSGLTSVVVGDGLVEIPDYCFSGCAALKEVTLGHAVTTIPEHAFSGCNQISSVSYRGTMAEASNIMVENNVNDTLLNQIWHCIDGEFDPSSNINAKFRQRDYTVFADSYTYIQFSIQGNATLVLQLDDTVIANLTTSYYKVEGWKHDPGEYSLKLFSLTDDGQMRLMDEATLRVVEV